ncbi:MAG: macro domain-containing protein [Candidatus Woesearchaeota archaeon]
MINVKLCTNDQLMYDAWKQEFKDKEKVRVILGNIFDEKTDAIVTSANSFGLMDAGLDQAMCDYFGNNLEERVQEKIKAFYFGEVPVGNALIIETFNPKIPYLISSPTMRVPMRLDNSVNVYLATRAALIAVYHHNIPNQTIKTVSLPAMGTNTGKMNYLDAAKQMRMAYDKIILGEYINLPSDWKIAVEEHNKLKN